MTRRAVILDTETTSLKPAYGTGTGVIWELAVMEYEEPGDRYVWQMKPNLAVADPAALGVGHFYERTAKNCRACSAPTRAYNLVHSQEGADPHWSSPEAVAAEVAVMLDGATIIAANPAFDAGFLTAFLNTCGQAATWHYRLRDIGSMAWGYCQRRGMKPGTVPAMDASTDDFAHALGVDPGRFERHSALGDCRLVAAMLNVIEGGAPWTP